jgi:glyoxylate/hydroxypyruvate reductase A
MKILFYSPGKDTGLWLESLRTRLPAAEVWAWTPESAQRQADYAVVWAPPADLFASQRDLKAVFNLGAGVDRLINLPHAASFMGKVPVVRLNDAGMAVQMAEYVCHALIRHARNFGVYHAQQTAGEWRVLPPVDRAAWPVGVMGLGDIGARVARSLAAFEYPTFGWSRTPKNLPGITTFSGRENLDRFLCSVRALVCVLPLTAGTRGILNRGTLSRLQPGGYLINVARGQHLVEKDLLALLDDGTLAGAALDVFADEPLPADHPFWSHPNVALTPHISAITLRDESVVQVAGKIAAMEAGQEISGVVAAERGY